MNYLGVLEATAVALVLRPYSTRLSNEIVAAPKVDGFDTGFVCAHRGWNELRRDDRGRLWEHYVLNEMSARVPITSLQYWRNKQGHEIDFIWQPRGKAPIAIECKWTAKDFSPSHFQIFAKSYPKASCIVVTDDASPAFTRDYAGLQIDFMALDKLIERLTSQAAGPFGAH